MAPPNETRKLSERLAERVYIDALAGMDEFVDGIEGLEVRIEALEKDRDEWSGAARHLLEHYPEDVFPPNSNTPDAKAGTFARRLLTWLLDPVERTRLAALVAEEPMQPTMYAGSSALREWADLHGEQGKGS